MVIIIVYCGYGGSDEIKLNGHAPNGKQKYLCHKCNRQSRENPTPNVYSEEKKEEIVRAYEERSSLRGLGRVFGVSRPTVIKWLKKSGTSARIERNVDRTRPK